MEEQTKIEHLKVGEVRPYEKNAKKHPDSQLNKIAASIREFGFAQPLVVDKNNVIIVGHGRFFAARDILKLETVPVIRVDLDGEKAKAYRLADNKLNESEWDISLVIPELKSMSVEMVELTGFKKDILLGNDSHDSSECRRCDELKKAVLGHQHHKGHIVKNLL